MKIKVNTCSKFSIVTVAPNEPQIESLTLKSRQLFDKNKGPWPFGSEDVPECFERSRFQNPEFEVCLKTGQAPGWIVVDIMIKPHDCLFAQDNPSQCVRLHHKQTLVAHVSNKTNAFAKMLLSLKDAGWQRPSRGIEFSIPDLKILRAFEDEPSAQQSLSQCCAKWLP